jgi:hypothetical protein
MASTSTPKMLPRRSASAKRSRLERGIAENPEVEVRFGAGITARLRAEQPHCLELTVCECGVGPQLLHRQHEIDLHAILSLANRRAADNPRRGACFGGQTAQQV